MKQSVAQKEAEYTAKEAVAAAKKIAQIEDLKQVRMGRMGA